MVNGLAWIVYVTRTDKKKPRPIRNRAGTLLWENNGIMIKKVVTLMKTSKNMLNDGISSSMC
ncbi:hypothetical protein HMPREF3213_04049 [Heyndrickxia coagulans]|uniref:Uncharacterized protein n=1 Tax=Heyndrickxia coagulans TaxID=1398 RepID=A0A133K9N7_HEYCO|nr:hypothetical protein HMPREF3213_04049 [Heyndrickxia coagulans]